MREFGYGARRALEPYRSPDEMTYQDPNVKPFFRTFRASPEERNSLAYSDYARQQDNMVLQEDQINQQLAAQREKLGQDKRKVARLEQVQDVEDQANEALNSGVPANQVIQQFPGLVQSPAFGRYAQLAKMATPAQQTLAPHYRKMLKRPEERADFDQAFQRFGNVSQADDYARTRAAERAHRVDLIESGVPLEHIEKAGPLNAERAALLKQQYKVSATGGNPHAMKGYEEWLKLRSQGAKEEAEALRAELAAQGINIFPPKPVAAPPTAPSVSGGATAVAGAPMPASSSAAPAAVEEGFPTPEKVQQAKAAHIGAPDADENFYSSFIADPKTPLPQKKVALEKFKQFVKTAPPPSHLTLGQVFARRNALDQAVEKAEKEVQLAPELEKYSEKWTEAKTNLDQLIHKTASRLGVPKQALVNSLVAGEGIPNPDDRGGKDISIPELINQTWQDEHPEEKGKGYHASMWERDHPLLEGFKKSKFANELGTKVLGFIPNGKTFGDVLDAYVAERKNKGSGRMPSAPVSSVAPQVLAPKIVIGKPRKITQ